MNLTKNGINTSFSQKYLCISIERTHPVSPRATVSRYRHKGVPRPSRGTRRTDTERDRGTSEAKSLEERRGAIIDTCVLASRKLGAMRTLNTKLYVTPIVLLEYLNWALESRNIWRAKGDDKRARGYERLIELLPSLLLELGIEVLEQKFTVTELREATGLVIQRGVDPGDALNAITAKKRKLGIITLDRDWERLPDYATPIITL